MTMRFDATPISCALAMLGLLACAPIPKPPILDEADLVSQAEAAKAAKAAAMPTWALAEKRRLMAHEAAETGLLAHAEFLAEESIATYEEGASLAALASSARREAEEKVLVESLSRELEGTESSIAVTLREIDALEARLRIANGSGASATGAGPATAEERTVLADVLWQGAISCTAAKLLRKAVTPAEGKADPMPALEATERTLLAALADKDLAKPIDRAAFHAYREACLDALVTSRSARVSGKADQLMTEVSRMLASSSARASRDERGVRVVMRGLFDGAKLEAKAAESWSALARVAKANPDFPVAVVVYRGRAGGADDVWASRKKVLAETFETVIVADASASAPTERGDGPVVELIFISPEAL